MPILCQTIAKELVETRADLAVCTADLSRSHAGLQADEAELPLFEGSTGLLALYLVAETILRPIWGRYFTTAFPPDRWLSPLLNIAFSFLCQLTIIIYYCRLMAWMQDGVHRCLSSCLERLSNNSRRTSNSGSSAPEQEVCTCVAYKCT